MNGCTVAGIAIGLYMAVGLATVLVLSHPVTRIRTFFRHGVHAVNAIWKLPRLFNGLAAIAKRLNAMPTKADLATWVAQVKTDLPALTAERDALKAQVAKDQSTISDLQDALAAAQAATNAATEASDTIDQSVIDDLKSIDTQITGK